MTQTSDFEAAAFAEKFNRQADRFHDLAEQAESERLQGLSDQLERNLRKHREDGILNVAFVGQYSAGKSTIISALTGRRDIEIDTDIATDETTAYDWNGIRLVDTPGLFTERTDHDNITYDAIEKADLLVFTLTYMLFDPVTLRNFERLAYEEGYRDKMMLVVNKMADEAGDADERIENYRQSLQDALDTHDLDEFDVSFIDALDYIDGHEMDDDFLVEESRFDSFIDSLNTFVDERGQLGRLDTPIRMLIGSVDDAHDAILQDETGDDAYLELLGRLSKRVRRERQRFRRRVKGSAMELRSSVTDLGNDIGTELGTLGEDELDDRLSKAEQTIENESEQTTREFQNHLEEATERLHDKVAEVLTGPLAENFVATLDHGRNLDGEAPDTSNEWSNRKEKWNNLQSIGEKAGVTISEAATSSNASVGGSALKAMDVSGSTLHKTVYNVGKFFGVKFQPYGAVNIAKFLGNAAKVAGPLLSIIGLAMDIAEAEQDEENARKLREARGELIAEFRKAGRELEEQFDEQRSLAEEKVFDPIEESIAEERKKAQQQQETEEELTEELTSIRNEAEGLLEDLRG